MESVMVRYLEAAKTQQVGRELEAVGYTVELEVAASDDPGAPRFDILARRGEAQLAIEVKVFGQEHPSAAEITKLRQIARSRGITDFQVVVAHPPPHVVAEVEDLEQLLEYYITEYTPTELLDISSYSEIHEVYDVDISELKVTKGVTYVVGDGVVNVNLALGGGESRDGIDVMESFPFRFTLTLDSALQILEGDIEVDTSSWGE